MESYRIRPYGRFPHRRRHKQRRVHSRSRGPGGYEVQIWNHSRYNTGSIVATAKTIRSSNSFRTSGTITDHGRRQVGILNSIKTLDVHDSQFSSGRIRLQYQKFPIEFKNIKLRTITR